MTTLGCIMRATARASRSKRSFCSGSSATCASMTFEGNVAIEQGVVGVVDDPHGPLAQPGQDLVLADTRGKSGAAASRLRLWRDFLRDPSSSQWIQRRAGRAFAPRGPEVSRKPDTPGAPGTPGALCVSTLVSPSCGSCGRLAVPPAPPIRPPDESALLSADQGADAGATDGRGADDHGALFLNACARNRVDGRQRWCGRRRGRDRRRARSRGPRRRRWQARARRSEPGGGGATGSIYSAGHGGGRCDRVRASRETRAVEVDRPAAPRPARAGAATPMAALRRIMASPWREGDEARPAPSVLPASRVRCQGNQPPPRPVAASGAATTGVGRARSAFQRVRRMEQQVNVPSGPSGEQYEPQDGGARIVPARPARRT